MLTEGWGWDCSAACLWTGVTLWLVGFLISLCVRYASMLKNQRRNPNHIANSYMRKTINYIDKPIAPPWHQHTGLHFKWVCRWAHLYRGADSAGGVEVSSGVRSRAGGLDSRLTASRCKKDIKDYFSNFLMSGQPTVKNESYQRSDHSLYRLAERREDAARRKSQ